jgi:hypothetical protein
MDIGRWCDDSQSFASEPVTRYYIVVWNAVLCITANLAANFSIGQNAKNSH